jgi:predicted PurR-regulated permease PerM
MDPSESERERFARVLFYAVVLAVGFMAFKVVAPFLAPMAWAAVFAMLMAPLATFLQRRFNRTTAATLATVVAALLIVGPAVAVLTVLVREVTGIVREIQQSGYDVPTPARLQELWDSVRGRILIPLPDDLSTAIGNAMKWVATYVAGMAGSVLQNAVGFVFQLFVMLSGLFFFLRDRTRIVNVIRHLLPFAPERRERLMSETYDLVVATVGSTFAVAVTQGALTGLALGTLGFRAPVFWGVMTSAFSVIPAVGSGIVWLPAAIWLFASGEVAKGIILVVFGTVVIGMADNVLRPLLLSGRTSMHGLLVFISLMGGIGAFGFIGLVMGPVAVATLTTLLEAVMPKPEPVVASAAPSATPPPEPPPGPPPPVAPSAETANNGPASG